jgi:hypothetical protein
MFRKTGLFAVALSLVCSPVALLAAEAATDVDLRRAAPADVHMAVFAKRNAERDYQREYFRDILDTVRDERIGERFLKIVTSRVPEEKLEGARGAWREVREALEPVNAEALFNAKECVFVQRLSGPFNQQLVAVRLSEDEAENVESAVKDVFELAAEWGEEKNISVETEEAGETTIIELRLPRESPFQPSVARVGNVVLLSTSPEFLRSSVELLTSDSGVSKFDDPRLKEAMEHLPEPEDCVVFFDGRQLWESMEGIGDFIREKAPDEEKARRAAEVVDKAVEEFGILDYEITVEYTEEGENRKAALGKMLDGYEDKLLGRALTQGEAFEDWQKWIPADATGFSMSTGVNLHVLYEGIINFVRAEFPESHEGLEKFAKLQEKIDVDFDKDVLQSFSGECVSVRFEFESENGAKTRQGVTALKCTDPEKVRELIGRAIEALQKLPPVQAQGLELIDVEGMDGFQEIRGNMIQMAGARPVIGFDNGWMIVASHVDAAKKLIAVRAGDAPAVTESDLLDEFDIDSDEAVYAASYRDVGEEIRTAADFIDKAAMMAPMFVGMAAAQAGKDATEGLQEAAGLLPSIAKVVRKFDFFADRLSITQKGPLPDSYIRHSVTHIRQPDEESEGDEDADAGGQ